MFGSALLREFDEDPFFRGHFDGIRQMHQSMNQMMRGFGGGFFGGPAMPAIGFSDPSTAANQQVAVRNPQPADPFGGLFADMHQMMGGMMGNMHTQMQTARNDPNSHFYSQSTVMSYSNTGRGPPKVYQASTSTHQAPGGVRETRRAVRDSSRNMEKMAIGHHIHDRAHMIERTRDTRTGDQEENQELINLDDDERETFDREFREKMGAYTRRGHGGGGHHHAALGAGRPERVRPRAIAAEPHHRHHHQHQQPQQGGRGHDVRPHPYRRTPPSPRQHYPSR